MPFNTKYFSRMILEFAEGIRDRFLINLAHNHSKSGSLRQERRFRCVAYYVRAHINVKVSPRGSCNVPNSHYLHENFTSIFSSEKSSIAIIY